MDISLLLHRTPMVKRGFHPLRYWVQSITISLVLPFFLFVLPVIVQLVIGHATSLSHIASLWWLYGGYSVIWLFWIRFFIKRAALLSAAEVVRQTAAAHDDVLTDSYGAPAATPDLLPITVASRARASTWVTIALLAGAIAFVVANALRGVGRSSAWTPGHIIFTFLFAAALVGFFLMLIRNELDQMRTIITADYAGITIRHLFTHEFMAWSDVRLFYTPVFATVITPMELEGRLLRRLRYLRGSDADAITEAIELEQCQLAGTDRVLTFPALRDEQHVPLHPSEYEAQVQRLIATIMQQTGLPLRMPSAEGVRFVAESLPFTSSWFKDHLDDSDPAETPQPQEQPG